MAPLHLPVLDNVEQLDELYDDDDCGAGQGQDELPRRPRTRGECIDGPRPCLHLSCRYNLALDVVHRGSSAELSVQENHPDPTEMLESCALDVADRGGVTLEEVGDLLGVGKERVRQIEPKAVKKLQHPVRSRKLEGFLPGSVAR